MIARTRTLLHRLVHPGGDAATDQLRKEVRRLTARLDQMKEIERVVQRLDRIEASLTAVTEVARRADRAAAQARLVPVLNRSSRLQIDRLASVLDEAPIAAHVRAAIASSAVWDDPYEHMVVEKLLPQDVYDLLIASIPPVAFFSDRDPIKQDLHFPMEYGPELSEQVWGYFDEVIAKRVIRPAVLDAFHAPLQRHFAAVFGEDAVDRANLLPQSVSGGRLMLRRPGYHLSPHRDPKRVMLTCLLYLARHGDSEAHGTQIFRVHDDSEAGYKQTYYPEEEGHRCDLVKVVPFRPNSMLVFLNSHGAHGATIPADEPADLERYTYQFYVAPQREALSALIKTLTPEQRARWQNKTDARPEYS
jgi:hypothetical protein